MRGSTKPCTAIALLVALAACSGANGADAGGAADVQDAAADVAVVDDAADIPIAPDTVAQDATPDASLDADGAGDAAEDAAKDATALTADTEGDAPDAQDGAVATDAADAAVAPCTSGADCAATEHCAAGACVADVCKKGAWACVGTVSGQCADDGSGLSGDQTDCATLPSTCGASVCNKSVGKCVVLLDLTTNGAPCVDSDPCTVATTCQDGVCGGGKAVSCDDADPCTADFCDIAVGCTATVLLTGACDLDGSACTADACVAGVCMPMPATDCSDNQPCTDDTCIDADGSCTHDALYDGTACDADGSLCTQGDACTAGLCIAGAPVNCDDGSPCTADACHALSGACTHDAVADGTACDADGTLCTANDACAFGTCVAGPPPNCDDANPCTADTCNPLSGCVSSPTLGPCDLDKSACTADTCVDGACTAAPPLVCDDKNPCTVDGCDAILGVCTQVSVVDGVACDADGSLCTVGDACAGGNCVAGKLPDCDDKNPCTVDTCAAETGCGHSWATGTCNDNDPCTTDDSCALGACGGLPVAATACDDKNPCTDDSCSEGIGCVHLANSATCNDGDPCTSGEACALGACTGGKGLCVCQKNADCAALEDGNVCNGTLFCDLSAFPYQCAVNPKTVIACPQPVGNVCLTAACDPLSGACSIVPVPEDTSCNADNSVCTVGDKCVAGTCKAGGALNCDDSNGCTTDKCIATSGCTHTASGGLCNLDNNPCTLNDYCSGTVCIGGTLVDCNDFNPCTTDACDPATVLCVFTPIADGGACAANPCATGGTCQAGVCTGTTPVNCTDSSACTVDVCSQSSGGCTHSTNPTVACDDGDQCTTEGCSMGMFCTHNAFLPNACLDNTSCTIDKCSANVCSHSPNPAFCNDGNACTTDICSGSSTCQHQPITGSCSDGSACTTGDNCATGSCLGTPLVCNDNTVCTTDSCNTSLGCVFTPISCDDKNACTTDSCAPGTGCAHVALAGCCSATADCDDGIACTNDACGADAKCVHLSNCCTTTDDCVAQDPVCYTTSCTAGACAYAPTNAPGCCTANLWHADFEASGLNGMTLSNQFGPMEGWQRIVSLTMARSGTDLLWYGNAATGNYDFGGSHGSAFTPNIGLPANTPAYLSFWVDMDTESGVYDDLHVRVNGVDLWSKFSTGLVVKLWHAILIDLSAYKGQTVSLEFYFDTVDSYGNATSGVYIDDVSVIAPCPGVQTCGDGQCNGTETHGTCPFDCP